MIFDRPPLSEQLLGLLYLAIGLLVVFLILLLLIYAWVRLCYYCNLHGDNGVTKLSEMRSFRKLLDTFESQGMILTVVGFERGSEPKMIVNYTMFDGQIVTEKLCYDTFNLLRNNKLTSWAKAPIQSDKKTQSLLPELTKR